MADVKNNYVSKYSGDQLDAAIAALGSLKDLFITQEDFKGFVNGTGEGDKHVAGFNDKMDKLDDAVGKMKDAADNATTAANNAKTEANNAEMTAQYASAYIAILSEKALIQYEEIVEN